MNNENKTEYTTEIENIVLNLKKAYDLTKHRKAREIIRLEILRLDALRTAIIKDKAVEKDTDSQSTDCVTKNNIDVTDKKH